MRKTPVLTGNAEGVARSNGSGSHATQETSDLDLAACFVTCGIKLIDAVRQGRTVFIFDDPADQCTKLKRQFLLGELHLPADKLLQNLRQLKWRLHHL